MSTGDGGLRTIELRFGALLLRGRVIEFGTVLVRKLLLIGGSLGKRTINNLYGRGCHFAFSAWKYLCNAHDSQRRSARRIYPCRESLADLVRPYCQCRAMADSSTDCTELFWRRRRALHQGRQVHDAWNAARWRVGRPVKPNPTLKRDRPCRTFLGAFVYLIIEGSAATGVACPLALRWAT